MGMIARLFGGKDIAEKTIDLVASSVKGVGNWVDEQQLTPEEKIKFTIDAARLNLEMVKITAGENGVRSVTRRYLAWGITLFCLGNAQAAVLLSINGSVDAVDSIIKVAEAFNLGAAFVAVMAFYFGVQIFRK